eukprot:scaffold36873_cov78-Phaeocystis_antarctica.AAC.16
MSTPTHAALIFNSSTSKRSVALGGISGMLPRLPYAVRGGHTSLRLPPTHIPATPASQPLITLPTPSLKCIVPESKRVVPFSSVPT